MLLALLGFGLALGNWAGLFADAGPPRDSLCVSHHGRGGGAAVNSERALCPLYASHLAMRQYPTIEHYPSIGVRASSVVHPASLAVLSGRVGSSLG